MINTVAVVQVPPVLLNRGKTMDRVIDSIDTAAERGASLIVFPEAYVAGYPTWIWRLRPGGDGALTAEIHARFLQNAVDLTADDLLPVREAAARHGVSVALGLNEIDSRFSGTTLFNTFVVIGPEGDILNRHRKMMPTNPERMVWGMGDASGLRVVNTPVGRLGGLICWENYMPLARYALYAQSMDIHVAPTWDTGDGWLASMRHIAREAGCWVISTATALVGSDMPADFPELAALYDPNEWVNGGDAVVIAPTGAVVAGPLNREKCHPVTPRSILKPRTPGTAIAGCGRPLLAAGYLLPGGGSQTAGAGQVATDERANRSGESRGR
ncbi:MAG: carbon-nitrogen hydrolase family protein [Halofilum sp. (in: g-proteobacteria)]|nr:carbon-nitrogen hydrolase family protein [Halofilum sp. (in: g-proteobacteria)]